MGADLGLEQVAEHVDAGAHLGHAVEMLRMQRGRRTAHRDDRRGMTGRAQPFGGAHHAGPLRLGDPRHVVRAAAGIGMAGMRHDAGEARAEPRGDLQQQVVVGRDAAAALAGIDLDQRPRRLPDARRSRRAVSRSSVSTMTAAPALFSLATWSSFCGVMPTA